MKSPSSMTDSPSFIHLLIFLLQTSSDFLNTADRFGLYNWSDVGRWYYSFLRFTGSLSLGSWTHGWSSSSVAEIYCCSGLRPSVITPWSWIFSILSWREPVPIWLVLPRPRGVRSLTSWSQIIDLDYKLECMVFVWLVQKYKTWSFVHFQQPDILNTTIHEAVNYPPYC